MDIGKNAAVVLVAFGAFEPRMSVFRSFMGPALIDELKRIFAL